MTGTYNNVELSETLHEPQPLVADNCTDPYVKHIVASFILTIGVLIFVAYLAPHPFGTITSKLDLPVFASSGFYSIKVNINNLSSYVEHIDLYGRFISNNTNEKYTTDGKITIYGLNLDNQSKPTNILLRPTTFNYVNGQNDNGWGKIISIKSPSSSSLSFYIHFNEPTQSKTMEIHTTYTRSSSVCFSIWARIVFLVFEIILFIYTFESNPNKIWTPTYFAFIGLSMMIMMSDIPGLFHFETPARWLAALSWVFGELRHAVCFGFAAWSMWMWNSSVGMRAGICLAAFSLLPLFIGLLKAFLISSSTDYKYNASADLFNNLITPTKGTGTGFGIGTVNAEGGAIEASLRIVLSICLCACGIVSVVKAPASKRMRSSAFLLLGIATLVPGAVAGVVLKAGSPLRVLAEIGGESFFVCLLLFMSTEMPVPTEYLYRKAGAMLTESVGSDDAGASIGVVTIGDEGTENDGSDL